MNQTFSSLESGLKNEISENMDGSTAPAEIATTNPFQDMLREHVEGSGEDTGKILESVLDANLLQEVQSAYTGKQELDNTGKVVYVEFYTGKVKRDGKIKKTGRVYWQFAIYQNGERLYRVSPKQYDPETFGYDGATTIEQCPYTGRVSNYWKKQKRESLGIDDNDTGFHGSEKKTASILDWFGRGQDIYPN